MTARERPTGLNGILRVFPSPEAVGAYAAGRAIDALLEGRQARGVMTLGCPAGRSARTTYAALGRLAAKRSLDLSDLHILMMDDFVRPAPGGGWARVPADAHFSCARFGEVEVRQALNAGLPAARQVPAAQVRLPDPNDPESYERLIETLGGVDAFLLASGESDGHVAFNPAGTPLTATTRVVTLAESTRVDNMGTFPEFRRLEDVPTHGVTVGPGTIARWSRQALMILIGAAKGEALARLAAADRYDPAWPATVVAACRRAAILADDDALAASKARG
jgi:glucosamine-6-phosphate deaminase